MNTELTYPALFKCSDEASNRNQRWYLGLLRLEYFLLTLAAVLSMNFSMSRVYNASFAAVFIASAAVLIWRTISKPEQDWYLARALAESVKTLTWRYVMHAEPFDSKTKASAISEFTDHLKRLLEENKRAASTIAGSDVDGNQLTPEMIKIRDGGLEERRSYYLEQRIKDQRRWYSNKSKANKLASRVWAGIGVATYAIAITLILVRVIDPTWQLLPTEPVIVIASAIVGWVQVKKFNELASAYALTANEIGIIQSLIEFTKSEEEFSRYVNDAELAFSREHTQWTARQTSEGGK